MIYFIILLCLLFIVINKDKIFIENTKIFQNKNQLCETFSTKTLFFQIHWGGDNFGDSVNKVFWNKFTGNKIRL